METKCCTACGANKPATREFFHFGKGVNLRAKCIPCVLAYTAERQIKKSISRDRDEAKQKWCPLEITCGSCGLPTPHWFRAGGRLKCNACKAIQRYPDRERPPFEQFRAKLLMVAESKYLRRYCGMNKCQSCGLVHPADDERKPNWRHVCFACERLTIRLYRHAAKARKGYDAAKRIRDALSRDGSSPTVESLLGYSIADLRRHIGLQLHDGMTWENMAGWHIDHIVSQDEWRATGDPEWWVKSWHLPNLRPMWGVDNISKGAKRIFLL